MPFLRRSSAARAARIDHRVTADGIVAIVDVTTATRLTADEAHAVLAADTVHPVWGRRQVRRARRHVGGEGTRPAAGSKCPIRPLVSVILPVYDGERYLTETLDAVLAQTFVDFELIVVDDASSDRSLEIARRVTAGLPHVRVVSLWRNTRKCGAVGVGLALAAGRYVMEINADDVLEPDALSRLTAPVRDGVEADCIFGDHTVIDARGVVRPQAAQRWSRSTGRADLTVGAVASARRRHLRHGLVPAGVCALIRRDVIGAWPAFTEAHTDYWLAWRGVRRERVWFVGPEPLARYREHEGGMTRSFHSRRRARTRLVMDAAVLRSIGLREAPALFRRFADHSFDLVFGPAVRARARTLVRRRAWQHGEFDEPSAR
ncbi:glycosyltransferase family 2 protein [Microbacterium testaceum]|uniref:glycosyltransferase family 2 protein n=1 Tax=Microbacterium testaceum TaxID=2033 RepID=UPI0009BC9D24|nr:glycosyltransferase family 2 protein [Microbacterium testaceum]